MIVRTTAFSLMYSYTGLSYSSSNRCYLNEGFRKMKSSPFSQESYTGQNALRPFSNDYLTD